MRAYFAVVAVAITVLLGAVAYELHQLNHHLAWLSAPVKALSTVGATTAETREERIDRRVRNIKDVSDETAEVLRRALSGSTGTGSATTPPSPKPAQTKAPRP
jgi:hypothetical protein